MTCPWRAIPLITVLTLAAAPLAWGQANTAPPPPASPAPTTPAPGDPFGEELTLASKTIVYMKGNSTWDTALDTLVDAGVARSRSDALAWCVRLVGKNADAWLADLREALQSVQKVRAAGPDAG